MIVWESYRKMAYYLLTTNCHRSLLPSSTCVCQFLGYLSNSAFMAAMLNNGKKLGIDACWFRPPFWIRHLNNFFIFRQLTTIGTIINRTELLIRFRDRRLEFCIVVSYSFELTFLFFGTNFPESNIFFLF